MMKVKIGISMEEDLSKKLEELSQEMGELKISKSELVEAILTGYSSGLVI
jgi:metal-responsive CopG/Arc/MetJ family transcriptional regulator